MTGPSALLGGCRLAHQLFDLIRRWHVTEDGGSPFADEAPGDLCYYAPWGNLVFFHDSYRYSKGLIRLGRLEDGIRPLLARGKYPLRIELLT